MTASTLVIILSETRAHELTYTSFEKHVLNPLQADLCLCIGRRSDYDETNPFWTRAMYRFTYPEPDDFAAAFDEVEQRVLGHSGGAWREYLRIQDQWLGGIRGGHPGSAGILIFFRAFLLQCLEEHGLMSRYDRFIVTRSDFVWKVDHPPMDLLDPRVVWFPDGEQYGGVTDRHVVLGSSNVAAYLDILPSLLTRKHEYLPIMSRRSDWNLEKVIALHLQLHGQRLGYFPYIMYSVRARDGTTRWSQGVWSEEHGCYIKYSTELHKANCARAMVEAQYRGDSGAFYASGGRCHPTTLPPFC